MEHTTEVMYKTARYAFVFQIKKDHKKIKVGSSKITD